jgi:hypothetical protein
VTSVLRALAEAVGPALAVHAVADPGAGRFEALLDRPERRFVLEAVYEGYLMHYGTPRVFEDLDPDLALLAGDALYALGLERLAAAGDLEAVAELSDLISLSARAQAEGDPQLAEALWEASAKALSSEGGAGARQVATDILPGAS